MGAARSTASNTASRELFAEFSERNHSKEAPSVQAAELPEHPDLPARSELLPGSPLFPRQLLQLKEVPPKLYALGDIRVLDTLAIAIVGARKATPYGLECARRFAAKAASWGITVVSGGAIGCDMAAHQGALDAGGRTIVVLGSGADVVYPLRARGLFREVLAAQGVLLSEAPWGSAPLAWAFSKRNRIIAALARATLIVEAGLPSGTFQTADHTLALGNEVLVVPGPIFSRESKGSNRLLVQGALPVVDDESFEDALQQIFGARYRVDSSFGNPVELPDADLAMDPLDAPTKESSTEISSAQGAASLEPKRQLILRPQELKLRQLIEHILSALNANPMTIDALASAYEKDVVEIIRIISKLELDNQVIRLRDGRYMKKPR